MTRSFIEKTVIVVLTLAVLVGIGHVLNPPAPSAFDQAIARHRGAVVVTEDSAGRGYVNGVPLPTRAESDELLRRDREKTAAAQERIRVARERLDAAMAECRRVGVVCSQ